MSCVELSYIQFKFDLFTITCNKDGMFQNKFSFKDNKVLSYEKHTHIQKYHTNKIYKKTVFTKKNETGCQRKC